MQNIDKVADGVKNQNIIILHLVILIVFMVLAHSAQLMLLQLEEGSIAKQLKQNQEDQIGFRIELRVAGIMKVDFLKVEDISQVVNVNAY